MAYLCFAKAFAIMEDSLKTIGIRQIRSILSTSDDAGLGDDVFICDLSSTAVNSEQEKAVLDLLQYPIRIDGYTVVFCVSGHISVDINLHSFNVSPNTLLINVPGNILRVGMSQVTDTLLSESRFILVVLSREFMSGVHFDFNKMFTDSLTLFNNPVITLTDEHIALAKQYFFLANDLLNPALANRREAVSSLLASLMYVFGSVWSQNILSAKEAGASASSLRLQQIFDRFIQLVTEYHDSERGMAFYADKLCLTPKYLSKLVKQASGRSAPDWIDAFVILEAKNMLKYSDVPIKEIVYKLHFPNQSVFYKFFKTHTGLTPSEYRKA